MRLEEKNKKRNLRKSAKQQHNIISRKKPNKFRTPKKFFLFAKKSQFFPVEISFLLEMRPA